METLKQYLPLIVIAIIGFYAIRKFGSGGGAPIRQTIPLTPTRQSSYTDPLLPFRAGGFAQLASVAQAQIEGETARDLAAKQREIESLRITSGAETSRFGFDLRQILGLRELDVREALGFESESTRRDIAEQNTALARFLEQSRTAQQQFLQNSYLQQLQAYLTNREQDRQLQQGAIDRVTGTQRTNSIIGSIGSVLNGIFNRSGGGSIFRTPPTFPGIGF